MSVARRWSVALTLVVAVVSGPLLAGYCADACAQAGAATAGATTPACHHTESPSSRIDSPPAPCGHQHQATLIVAPSTGPSTRAVVHSLGIVPELTVVNAALSRGVSIAAPNLPPDRAAHAAPSPLRI